MKNHVIATIGLLLGVLSHTAIAAEERGALPWQTDYREAMQMARDEQKLLLIYFFAETPAAAEDPFERDVLLHDEVREVLDRFVLARLPVSAEIMADGKPIRLLRHGAFAELRGQPGLAVVDHANVGARHYGYVVSVLPFRGGKHIDRQGFKVLSELPPGTLTQRTLIYAVRTHPQRPNSAAGEFHPLLAAESESHAAHQARIALQGHHNWEQRFHRINGRLANGMTAQEVCAESWPGQKLVEAAEECVHSWRQSPGHWSTVSASHPLFAYDMKLGANGVWYATGIFAHR